MKIGWEIRNVLYFEDLENSVMEAAIFVLSVSEVIITELWEKLFPPGRIFLLPYTFKCIYFHIDYQFAHIKSIFSSVGGFYFFPTKNKYLIKYSKW